MEKEKKLKPDSNVDYEMAGVFDLLLDRENYNLIVKAPISGAILAVKYDPAPSYTLYLLFLHIHTS